jgi:hypothetical protein
MRTWQLEYGAEIGSGGDQLPRARSSWSSSVIGGAPATAAIFAREISARTETDLRVTGIRARLAADPANAPAEPRHQLAGVAGWSAPGSSSR